jgi:DNA topoisomerase-3
MAERIGMVGSVRGASPELSVCAAELLETGLNIDRKIVDDSKVTDHHALIPTERIKDFDLDSLKPVNQKEIKEGITGTALKNVMVLVLNRMIVAFSQPCIYNQTRLTITFANKMTFTATGKCPIQEGWKQVQTRLIGAKSEEENPSVEDQEQSLPKLSVGQSVYVEECVVKAKKTTPPKLHTEATLLTAMETAGRGIQGGESIKGKGIGTQATRAEIIKSLFEKGYVEYRKKGKVNYIIPTTLGIRVIQVIPQELYSPKITADWESKFGEIIAGSMTESQFMEEFQGFIREKTDQVRSAEATVSFAKEKPVVATCPWCGSGMYRWDDREHKAKIRYYCSNKECHCSLSSDDKIILQWLKKPLTEKQIQIFLRDGEIFLMVPSMYDKEKKFKRKFVLEKKTAGDKVYCNVVSVNAKK